MKKEERCLKKIKSLEEKMLFASPKQASKITQKIIRLKLKFF